MGEDGNHMTSYDHVNFTRQNEILKKRISSMLLKEYTKGLDSNEIYIKRAAIKQLYTMLNHQSHR